VAVGLLFVGADLLLAGRDFLPDALGLAAAAVGATVLARESADGWARLSPISFAAGVPLAAVAAITDLPAGLAGLPGLLAFGGVCGLPVQAALLRGDAPPADPRPVAGPARVRLLLAGGAFAAAAALAAGRGVPARSLPLAGLAGVLLVWVAWQLVRVRRRGRERPRRLPLPFALLYVLPLAAAHAWAIGLLLSGCEETFTLRGEFAAPLLLLLSLGVAGASLALVRAAAVRRAWRTVAGPDRP
jgi:hypothetical protein